MRTARRLSALALLAAFPATPTLALAADTAKTPAGYTKATADANAVFEKILLDTPTPDNARRWLAQLTEDPHVAGTPAEKKVADWVNAKLKEFGLETEMVKYDVFLNHPKSVSLKMVEPRVEELSLREDNFPGDKDSTSRGQFPAFHGYGASGKANGEIVYVNYGSPADHERLKGMGISVEGKIALVKYGGAFRGLKVKEAQDRGAIGVLIYSDPADDGYMKGDVYPNGPMRPASSLQRGSVQFLSIQPGDPSTPGGFPSVAGAKRITRDQMTNVPKIPSLPISYREAEKLLTNLGGPRVPDDWQGGLPFSYHIGPGGAAVEMDVQMDEGLKPIYNVIAKIPGATDQVVLIGNHRDAWTPGAVDPNSGTAAMLEAARGLGAAVKAGWKPKRTILICSWDAEEYGLVGSTEWAEENGAMLQSKAVAYFNMDVAVTGPNFGSSGTPSLREAVREAAASVPEPRKGGTVGAAWEARSKSSWASSEPVHLDTKDSSFELQLGRLGSGSDYTAFVDHLGIPSTDGGFSGAYGVYHSVYDNFYWMSHFGDPEFIYHQAAARYLGLLAFRTATADIAPLRFANYGGAMKDDLDEIRTDVVRRARTAGANPFEPDFTGLSNAVADLDAAGKVVDAATDAVLAKGEAATFAKMSDALAQVERAFLNKDGLPGRPWFKHQLIGPGLTTGYAPWPFPALREAVEKKDKAMFETEAKRIVAALDAGTAKLKAAAAIH
ncbi:MAG: M28 family metallopeptidase [Vicinamibacteria bacterium]